MVNTFLPFPDFAQSAKSLDMKRLGKQRVEAVQILRANLGLSKGWRNHPAAKMWQGYEYYLAQYGAAICREWINRGYKDSLLSEFEKALEVLEPTKPWWLGVQKFHDSHKSNLKRKNPSHYEWDGPDDLPYLWPTEDQSFRTVE